MAEAYMMAQHSPAPWTTSPYPHYPQPGMMASMPEYMNPVVARHIPSPLMSAPNLSRHQVPRGHNRTTSTGPWTPEEDEILLQAKQKGLGWSQIQQQFLPGKKTGNACRKRHERLLQKRRGSDWDDARLERLAVAYKNRRQQIWQELAESIGEKWEHVEKIAFQQGLSTLKNKASSHARHSSSGSSNGMRASREYDHSSDEFNDSGLGLALDNMRRSTRRQSLHAAPASLDNILQPDPRHTYGNY